MAQLRTYVVGLDHAKLGAIGAVVGATWGDRAPTQTMIGVASLAMPEILFEVEAVRPSWVTFACRGMRQNEVL